MKLNEINNFEFLQQVENAGELVKIRKYKSKDFLTKYIGLSLHRTGFYGKNVNGDLTALDTSVISFNSDTDIKLHIEGVVSVTSAPTNTGAGGITYSGYGLLESNGVILYDGRTQGVSANLTSDGVLNTSTLPGLNVTEVVESLDGDITAIENNLQTIQFKVTYYEIIDISAGTSGSLTGTPSETTILLGDEFGGSGEAILSTLVPNDLTGVPDFNTPDNGGPVTVALNGDGTWNTNNTYVDPVALIYKFTIAFSNFSNVNLDYVIEFFKDTINSDEVGNLSNVTGADVTAALNTLDTDISNIVSADGSVLTHNDVTDAGSGAIITASERTKLDGIEANANNYSHPDHTGDVTSTGDGATVIDPTAITGKPFVTPTNTDLILIADADDTNKLKRVTAQSIADLKEVGTLSPLTTKGDLYTYDTDNQRLGVGPNNSILVADSTTSTGLRWEANTSNYFATDLLGGSWVLDSGETYYQDVNHGFNSYDVVIEIFDYTTKETVIPEKVQRISTGTVRVFVQGTTENLRVAVWKGVFGVQGASGLTSVTGDGVDNTDPLNPVLTFPTSSQIIEDTDKNFISDAEKAKLIALESSKFLGEYVSLGALQTAHPSPAVGSYGYVDAGIGSDVLTYIWDSTDNDYVLQLGSSNAETTATIQAKRPLKTVNGESLEGSGDVVTNGGKTVVSNPTTPHTADKNEVILWDATSGNKVVNLPAASTSTNFVIDIKKTDSSSNTVTIDGNASETIDGELTKILSSQYESITVICDGSNWFII